MRECDNICIITGAPQCGKTTFLQKIITFARSQKLNLGGFIAIGLWNGNQRAGFILKDLATGNQVPLSGRSAASTNPGGYVFYAEGFAAGLRTLTPEALADKDLIFIDEVGWLETRGDGWANALPYLVNTAVRQIWVVREGMVDEVCAAWNFKPGTVINVTTQNAWNTFLEWLNAK